jgi:hypothetical protein
VIIFVAVSLQALGLQVDLSFYLDGYYGCCMSKAEVTPIIDSEEGCSLLGIASDCGFTVDEFLARTRKDNANNSQQFSSR